MKETKKLLNSRPIFYGFLALLLAISTAKFIFEGSLKHIIFDIVVFALFVAYCIWKKRLKILAVVFAVFMLGLGWFFVGLTTFEGREFSGSVNVVGRISDDIKRSRYDDDATVVLKDVRVAAQSIGNVKLTISDFGDLQTGDVISFTTQLEKVKLFELGAFNQSAYRDKTPYVAQISSKEVTVHEKNVVAFDEKCRMAVKDALYQNMGEENGAYAYAVLFGDKNDLSSEIYNNFVAAGIVHLLTTSGLHISFLLAILAFFLKKIHLKTLPNLAICVGFLLFYCYLCGFAPSILRAGLMGVVLFFTKLSGKCYDGLNSLGLAGSIMLILSPLSALDNGFLMSFFCVMSIFVLAPVLTNAFRKIFPKFVASSFAISFSATLGILPFAAEIFANFNFLSFFVNLIAVPVFSLIFPILFVSAFLCTFMPLGFMLKFCSFGLILVRNIAIFFGQTHLQTTLRPIDVFLKAAYFVTLFSFGRFLLQSKRARLISCASLVLVCGLVFGLSYVQMPVGASIVYGYDNSYSTLVLTNSQSQSIIVDFGDEEYCRKLLNSLNIKNISTAFVLQKPTVLIDSAREVGVTTLIRCDEGQGYDEEVIFSANTAGKIGGFSFKYVAYGSTLVGLEIMFDETSVFVLRDRNASENALKFAAAEDYDFVVLGRHANYANFFANSKILAYSETEDANIFSTFSKNGNVKISVDEKTYKRRCLD